MKKLLTAIAHFPSSEKKFIKYRNVSNTKSLEKHLMEKQAHHVNYYCPKTKQYLYQVVFECEKNR